MAGEGRGGQLCDSGYHWLLLWIFDGKDGGNGRESAGNVKFWSMKDAAGRKYDRETAGIQKRADGWFVGSFSVGKHDGGGMYVHGRLPECGVNRCSGLLADGGGTEVQHFGESRAGMHS